MGQREADRFFQQHMANDPVFQPPVPSYAAPRPTPKKKEEDDSWWPSGRQVAATGVRALSSIAPEAVLAASVAAAPETLGASVPLGVLAHFGLRFLSGKYGEKAARAIEGLPSDPTQENIQGAINAVPLPGFRALTPGARIAAHAGTGAALSGASAGLSEYAATGTVDPSNLLEPVALGAALGGAGGAWAEKLRRGKAPTAATEVKVPTPIAEEAAQALAQDVVRPRTLDLPNAPRTPRSSIKELLASEAKLKAAAAEAPVAADPIGTAVAQGQQERAAALPQRQGTPAILATTRDTTVLEPTAGLGAQAQQPVLGGTRVPEALAQTPMDLSVDPVALAKESQTQAVRPELQSFMPERGTVPTGWDATIQGKTSLGDESAGLGLPSHDIPSGGMTLDVNTDLPLITEALAPSRGMQIAPDVKVPTPRAKRGGAIPLPSKTARFEPKTIETLLLPEKSSAEKMSARMFVEKIASGDLDPSHVSLVDLIGKAFSLGETGAVGKLNPAQQIEGAAARQSRKIARGEILRRVEQRMQDGLSEAAALDAEGLSQTMYRALVNAADAPGLVDPTGSPIAHAPIIAGVDGSLQPELYNSAMRIVEKTPILDALRNPETKATAQMMVRNAALKDTQNTITKERARATGTPTLNVNGTDYPIRDAGNMIVRGMSTQDPMLVAAQMSGSADPRHPVTAAFTDPIFDLRDNRYLGQKAGEDAVADLSQRHTVKVGSTADVSARRVLEGTGTALDAEVVSRAGLDGEKLQALSRETRMVYDTYLERINAERAKRGVDPIPRRENYFTHMNELQAFDQVVGGLLTESSDKINQFVKAKMPAFGAALARGLPETPIANALTRMEQRGKIGAFTSRAARKLIGVEPPGVLDGLKLYIDRAEDMLARAHAADQLDTVIAQLPEGNAKTYWKNYTQRVLRGELYNEEQVLSKVLRPVQALTNLTTNAIASFSAKIGLTQIASVPQTYVALTHNATPLQAAQDFLHGTALLRDPEVKQAIATITRKNPMLDTQVFQRSTRKSVREFGNWFANQTDAFVFQHAFAAAYAQAKRLGYVGKQALRYAEDIASRAQGSEVREMRPPVFTHGVGRVYGPFQYFAQNLYNLGVRWNKALGSDKKQMEYLMIFLAAQFAAHHMSKQLTGMSTNWDTNQSLSANLTRNLPWVGWLQYDGTPLISQAKKTYKWLTGTPDMYGQDVSGWDVAAGMFPYGGTQLKRTITGAQDVLKGYHGTPESLQYLVRGATDTIKALLYGPSGTNAAQKERDRKQKMQDMLKR